MGLLSTFDLLRLAQSPPGTWKPAGIRDYSLPSFITGNGRSDTGPAISAYFERHPNPLDPDDVDRWLRRSWLPFLSWIQEQRRGPYSSLIKNTRLQFFRSNRCRTPRGSSTSLCAAIADLCQAHTREQLVSIAAKCHAERNQSSRLVGMTNRLCGNDPRRLTLDHWMWNGGRTRTRTLDPLIKSQLLYQLSYAP